MGNKQLDSRLRLISEKIGDLNQISAESELLCTLLKTERGCGTIHTGVENMPLVYLSVRTGVAFRQIELPSDMNVEALVMDVLDGVAQRRVKIGKELSAELVTLSKFVDA